LVATRNTSTSPAALERLAARHRAPICQCSAPTQSKQRLARHAAPRTKTGERTYPRPLPLPAADDSFKKLTASDTAVCRITEGSPLPSATAAPSPSEAPSPISCGVGGAPPGHSRCGTCTLPRNCSMKLRRRTLPLSPRGPCCAFAKEARHATSSLLSWRPSMSLRTGAEAQRVSKGRARALHTSLADVVITAHGAKHTHHQGTAPAHHRHADPITTGPHGINRCRST